MLKKCRNAVGWAFLPTITDKMFSGCLKPPTLSYFHQNYLSGCLKN
ncbi:MAG: hypothetical protein J5680_01400 [Neisseriaceae bacterium]|nr:hypothetical protein [Neisseriaceae bacterium]